MTLGTSGASITLEVAEDGTCSVAISQGVASYSTAFDGTLESGTARNGNTYTLSRDPSGTWTVIFVTPDAVACLVIPIGLVWGRPDTMALVG